MQQDYSKYPEKETIDEDIKQWFVMRDLKPANTKHPAYKTLQEQAFEVFTPMKWRWVESFGKKEKRYVPYIQDLLFVHTSREKLDPIVANTETLQYRFVKGGKFREAMIVPDKDMEHFINAIRNSPSFIYYTLGEITPRMYNRMIRIIGGPLNGYEGLLVTVRGSKVKRLLVNLPMLLSAAVEVDSEFIQLI